jgi:succinoglycan biosynthesis protein ExoA
MDSLQPSVSVILPCRNEAQHIEDCLNSILQQQEPEGGFEIIVADGMSGDGTREILAQLGRVVSDQWSVVSSPVVSSPVVRLIANPGRIVSTGVNAAIQAARGEIIIRMDAHTEYASDYVRQCVAVLRATGADNTGGPARTKARSYLEKAVAAAYHSPFAVGGARFHDPDYEGYVDTVTYGCWRREVFERFGYFDEELVRNQDDEHNLRITRGGGKIWQSPKIKSWYRPRGSLTALFKQYMQYGYWKVRVIQKHRLPASWRHLVPGAFVFALMLLFLLSALCFLLSAFSSGHSSVVSGPPWHFCFLLSAFCSISLLCTYALAVLLVSVVTAWRSEWKLLLVLPLVFPCYHFGYGYGFLRGIWDFVLRKKSPGKTFGTLTR